MKAINKLTILASMLLLVIFISGCVEQQYTREYREPAQPATSIQPLQPSQTVGQQRQASQQSDTLMESQLEQLTDQDSTDLALLEQELTA